MPRGPLDWEDRLAGEPPVTGSMAARPRSLDGLRGEPPHSPVDGDVVNGDTAVGQQLLNIPGAGDYSLGALAAGLRDLLVVLGHERATLVGHSLGGGIAMQFAYQFPEITERLVLVSSGGLGPEVSPVLRAAALPGADLFIAATAAAGRSAGAALARGLAAAGLRPTADIAEVARGYASLADPGRRAAFLATLRSVIGVGGQRVYAGDRLYLAEGMPVLIMWGARDPIIPVRHGEHAHQVIPGSRLEIFDRVGHLPQLEAPGRFVAALERFLEQTEPAQFDARKWRARFRSAADGA